MITLRFARVSTALHHAAHHAAWHHAHPRTHTRTMPRKKAAATKAGVEAWDGASDASDADLDEDEMNLARTEGLDLPPLECSSVAEVQRWIKESRFR